jgi:hypothetical protein
LRGTLRVALKSDSADIGRQSGATSSAIIKGTVRSGTLYSARITTLRLKNSSFAKLGIYLRNGSSHTTR